jgi:hypothetical protein
MCWRPFGGKGHPRIKDFNVPLLPGHAGVPGRPCATPGTVARGVCTHLVRLLLPPLAVRGEGVHFLNGPHHRLYLMKADSVPASLRQHLRGHAVATGNPRRSKDILRNLERPLRRGRQGLRSLGAMCPYYAQRNAYPKPLHRWSPFDRHRWVSQKRGWNGGLLRCMVRQKISFHYTFPPALGMLASRLLVRDARISRES